MFAVDESDSDLSEFCPYDYENCPENKWKHIVEMTDNLSEASQLVLTVLQDELSPQKYAVKVLAEAF